ncbi:energy transducer TonB [Plebeiibacterium sediminum]|uniref:Energy transducer TonB n=1 Tax=Plebeiibacterium sediminum TaxID=2992112 RepID=A0AAE3SHR3_9BACT|nr:hypothetical protein [Plebeiobacterium sediminum]MCW3789527.1 energy transducer TonB [Plebeiobacterium sediminum]
MKQTLYILLLFFSIEAYSQDKSVVVNFSPAFIYNSSLKINVDSIEFAIEELNFKEKEAIKEIDYRQIVQFFEKHKFDSQKDEVFGEDGVIVNGFLTGIDSINEFQFWSPNENTWNCNLSHLLITISEKSFVNDTTLHYLACLSEYFPFYTKKACLDCEVFSTETYFMCDTMPEFPNGIIGLKEYLKVSLQNSSVLQNYMEETTFYVSFVVLKSGKLTKIKMANKSNVNPQIANEIIKIVELMPRWKPGMLNGKLIDIQIMIPIKLNTE